MIDTHTLKATVEELLAETDEIFPEILRTRLRRCRASSSCSTPLESNEIPKANRHQQPAVVRRARARCIQLSAAVLANPDLGRHHARQATPRNLSEGGQAPECPPGQMLVLEDSQNGCRAAVAAGAITVAVPGAHSRQHDFTGAALVADTLADRRIYEMLAFAQTA